MQPSADHEPHVEGTIWMRDLDELPVEVSPLVPAVFGPLGLERSAQLAEAMHSTLEELHQRFSGGRRCCGVWVEDHLASYGWISFEEEFVGELRLRLKLLPGEAYIWDCATLPAYRSSISTAPCWLICWRSCARNRSAASGSAPIRLTRSLSAACSGPVFTMSPTW